MKETLSELFSTSFFMPHGHCYLWQPAMLWTQVLTNALIGLSYVAIAGMLVLLARRVKDLPFRPVYLAFGTFIIACGITHFMDVWVIWEPYYWLDGSIRFVTAAASVGTALMLPPLFPKVLALVRGARAAELRGLQLETMVADLETLYERTKLLDRQRTAFFANASHELRTPLTLLLSSAELRLSDPALSPADREAFSTVQRSGRILQRLVSQFLEIARLEAGAEPFEPRRVELRAFLQRCVGLFESHAHERGVRPVLELPEAPVWITADPEKLERVVMNLVANALRFAPPGGQVRTTLRAEGAGEAGRVRLEVADDGPGVPEAERELIFERFRQAGGATQRASGGSGLGLSIVRELVQLHGGGVSVGDAPEGGALFTLDLPRGAVGQEEEKARDRASAVGVLEELREVQASSAEPVISGVGEQTVVVAEDNAEMRHFLARVLGERHRVVACADGAGALEQARAQGAHLIVTDVMMPGMGGEELVERARADEHLADVPILVLTAREEERLRVRLLGAGAQDFLPKPFSVDELRVRAENLIAQKRARDLLGAALSSREQDITTLATMVAERKAELERALAEAEEARAEAERASQLKSKFLNMVSHELRTPLSALRLQLALLERLEPRGESSKRAEVLARMESSSKRLEELVDELLEGARLEAAGLTPAWEPVDVGELLEEVVEEAKTSAQHRGLALELERPEGLGAIQTDPRLLRLVASNLVSNAVKYTERGGVTVKVRARGADRLEIAVRDTGPGIAPEDHQRIFEPFAQVSERARSVPGVGLGLSLVRDVVRGLGGVVELESAPGEGSTFRVVLPRSPGR